MNEKKMKIIETGLTLFAEKGYHATSIQEIASEAGISKGAFYLYFQSKEDFITTAIGYFQEQISDRMKKIGNQSTSPKEGLAKQINLIADYIYTYKGFIAMFFMENISISEKADTLMHEMKVDNYRWLQKQILSIYGKEVQPYLTDSMIQLEGLTSSYFKWIILDDIQLDMEQLGAFIVRRLDDVVQGMLREEQSPLVTLNFSPTQVKKENLTDLLDRIREKIVAIPVSEKQQQQLKEVVSEIEQEAQAKQTKAIVIQGLLAHLTRYPVLHDECERIASVLNIELLH